MGYLTINLLLIHC